MSPKLNQFVLQITSDAACGRMEQALETVEFVCNLFSTDANLFNEFLEIYQNANHNSNPDLFEITMRLLKAQGQGSFNNSISHLLCMKSICFKPNQILKMLESLTTFDYVEYYSKKKNPMLVSYLNGEIEKVKIFLAFGIDSSVEYECVSIMTFTEIDGEKECFNFILHSKPQFVGMTLEQVILIENPDLLLAKSVGMAGNC